MPLYGANQAPAGNTAPMGGVSTYSSMDEAIRAAAPYGQGAIDQAVAEYNNQLTVVGQGSGWLSPEELRARTNALDTRNGTPYGGASGGGSSGGMPGSSAGSSSGQTSSGLLGGLTSGGTQQPSGPGGMGSFPGVNIGTPGGFNQQPGSQPISQPGNQPGSQPGQMGQQLPMMQSSAQNGLQGYYNTPGYQLTNGMGAVNQFQTSPGYQFAVNEALGQVQRQGASRGLLDSGAGLRAMTDRAQGMAQQEFNNWQQNQQNQYNQYQNRLAGLASGPTGADQAYSLGQGMANNAMQTGSNIGSILANQGNSLFGGIVGAGGAQAQNVTQAGNMQAQILGGNLQTQMMLAALAGGQR